MKRPDDCKSSFWPLNLNHCEEAIKKKELTEIGADTEI